MKPRRVLLSVAVMAIVPTLTGAQNVDMGETFHDLDARATKVTTHFLDVSAVTRREPNGILSAGLYTVRGELLGSLAIDTRSNVLTLAMSDQPILEYDLASAPFEQMAADWLNAQLYVLWQDAQSRQPAAEAPEAPMWQGRYLRYSSATHAARGETPGAHEQRVAAEIQSVETDFKEFIAIAERLPEPLRTLKPSGTAGGPHYAEFSTRLFDARAGTQLGILHWIPQPRLLIFDFPGITSGGIVEEAIPGGMPVTPNLAWSTIQALVLWEFRPVSGAENLLPEPSCGEDFAGALNANQVWNMNEEGCDGLHWLDGTLYRPCCDAHDSCYWKYACTYKSWWTFGEGWRCNVCNIAAIYCFACIGNPSCDGECCYRDQDGDCPPECGICC